MTLSKLGVPNRWGWKVPVTGLEREERKEAGRPTSPLARHINVHTVCITPLLLQTLLITCEFTQERSHFRVRIAHTVPTRGQILKRTCVHILERSLTFVPSALIALQIKGA